MKYIHLLLALGLGLISTTASPWAQGGPLLAQGTQITATMDTQLSTATANPGDPFTMHVTPPYPNNDDRYAGAVISGRVLAVTRASRGTTPQLQLGIERLTLNDGTSVDLDAQVTSEQSQTAQKNGAKVAAETLGGMIIGNIIGKTVFQAAGGGLIGAVGGLLYGLNDKTNITVQTGSKITVTVARDIVIRRQATP